MSPDLRQRIETELQSYDVRTVAKNHYVPLQTIVGIAHQLAEKARRQALAERTKRHYAAVERLRRKHHLPDPNKEERAKLDSIIVGDFRWKGRRPRRPRELAAVAKSASVRRRKRS